MTIRKVPGQPQTEISIVDRPVAPKGYEQLDDLSAAVGLTPPADAALAILQAEAQDVRWRDDGDDPTASVGMLLTAGQDFVYTGDLSAIKFLEKTSGAILNVSYYGHQ